MDPNVRGEWGENGVGEWARARLCREIQSMINNLIISLSFMGHYWRIWSRRMKQSDLFSSESFLVAE